MIFTNMRLALFALLASSALATDCDSLKACYLRNLSTNKEITLSGVDSYKIDANNKAGYSIRCLVNYKSGTESNFIKFFWDGKDQTEWNEPRWMLGDSGTGDYVVPVPYLATCGAKTVKIEGHVWSQKCFDKEYKLTAQCDGGSPPIAAPTVITAPKAAAPVVASPKASPVAVIAPAASSPMAAPKASGPVAAAPTVVSAPNASAPVSVVAPKASAPAAAAPAVVAPNAFAPSVAAPAVVVAPQAAAPSSASVPSAPRAPMAGDAAPSAPKAAAPMVASPSTASPVAVSPTAGAAPVAPVASSPVVASPVASAPIAASPVAKAPVPVAPVAMAPAAAPTKTCPPGYKLVSGCCVVVACSNDYQCPKDMIRIPNRKCYNSIADCKCKKGYTKRMLAGRRNRSGSSCRRTIICKYGMNWWGTCKRAP